MEEQFRQQIDALDEVPVSGWEPTVAWDRIDAELRPKRRRAFVWWYAAASVILLVGFGLWYLGQDGGTTQAPLAETPVQENTGPSDSASDLSLTKTTKLPLHQSIEEEEAAALASSPTSAGKTLEQQASETSSAQDDRANRSDDPSARLATAPSLPSSLPDDQAVPQKPNRAIETPVPTTDDTPAAELAAAEESKPPKQEQLNAQVPDASPEHEELALAEEATEPARDIVAVVAPTEQRFTAQTPKQKGRFQFRMGWPKGKNNRTDADETTDAVGFSVKANL